MKIKQLITKKFLLVVSMLTVMLSLSGCGEELDKPFEYDEQQIVLDTMSAFEQYKNVSDEFADYYLNDGDEFTKSAVKGIKQAENNDKVGEFEDFSQYINVAEPVPADKYTIVNSADSVSVTVVNSAQNRDVEITVKFVENPTYYMEYDKLASTISVEGFRQELAMYGWDEQEYLDAYGFSSAEEVVDMALSSIDYELQSEGILPYTAEEMVVSAVYSKSELMASAGRNTLIGMGTVFVVLIFISFIISLFKFLPALFAKKPKLEIEKPSEAAKTQEKPVTKETAASNDDDLMNDAELVAVITAAIYAASGSAAGATSKDKLIVRSIRRARR